MSDLVEAAETLSKGSSPNSDRIPTSVGAGQAPRYRELATVAHAAGFTDVSPTQVHEWRVDGLLPPTGEQVSAGRRQGFATVRTPGVEEQLLALCDVRRETKSWNRLAILLWVDGWPITIERLKTAVLAEMPGRIDVSGPSDKVFDQVDELARRRGPGLFRQLSLGRIGPRVAAEATYLALLQGFGRLGELDETGERTVRRAAGLTRSSSSDADDPAPEPAGPASRSFGEFLGLFPVAHLHAVVEGASGVVILAARPRARLLLRDLPDLVRASELVGGRPTARSLGGVGTLGRLLPRVPGLAVAVPIILAEAGLADRFDAALDPLRKLADSVREPTRAGEIYLRKHPEQAGLIRKIGLQGLDERGLLVPLDPLDMAEALTEADRRIVGSSRGRMPLGLSWSERGGSPETQA